MMKTKQVFQLILLTTILLSFYFIYHRMQLSQAQIAVWHLDKIKALFVILSVGFVYAMSNLILSYNWTRFLKILSEKNIPFWPCNYIYSVSCLAKYVPGSILQYTNRQMLGKIYNLSQINLLVASYLEIFGIMLAASIVGFSCFLSVQLHDKVLLFGGFLFLLIFLILIFPLFYKFAHNFKYIKNLQLPRLQLKNHGFKWLLLLCYYVGYYVISGLLLLFTVKLLAPHIISYHLLTVISIWSLAWLAGYIVIFAPAGLGIREAVLIALLTPMIGSHAAIIITIVFRISLILGDIIFAGFGWISKYLL